MSATGNPLGSEAGRRGALLDAARDEFAVRGFHGTSIRDIAGRVGMLGGSVYYYIDSKEELLYELFERVYDPALRLLEGIDADPAAALGELERFLCRHVEMVVGDLMGTALVFNEAAALSEEHRQAAAAIERRFGLTLRELVSRARAHGDARADVDPSLAALAMLGAINWMHRWFRPDGPVPRDRVGSRMARILVHGIAVPEARGDELPFSAASPVYALSRDGSGAADRSGRRDEVIRTAGVMFAERGFGSTTLQDIADRVGVRKASLYHYVRSKAELLYLVLRAVHEPAFAALEHVLDKPWTPLQKLRVLTVFHVVQRAENMVVMRLMLQERRELADEHRAQILENERTHRHALRDLIVAAQRDGSVRADVQPDVACHALVGAMNWVHHWYRPDGARGPVDVGRHIAATVIDGVADATQVSGR